MTGWIEARRRAWAEHVRLATSYEGSPRTRYYRIVFLDRDSTPLEAIAGLLLQAGAALLVLAEVRDGSLWYRCGAVVASLALCGVMSAEGLRYFRARASGREGRRSR